jgi:hypothetical protein
MYAPATGIMPQAVHSSIKRVTEGQEAQLHGRERNVKIPDETRQRDYYLRQYQGQTVARAPRVTVGPATLCKPDYVDVVILIRCYYQELTPDRNRLERESDRQDP